jgi:hypothetical protein
MAHGYTPTHYVAPFASVSGASSDEHELGATAWSNATSPLTPTTMGTAMVRATAGNIVECAFGDYLGTATNANWDPCWHTINSGTSGNPIVIVAANPASQYRAFPGILCKLSNGSTVDGAGAVYGFRSFAGGLNNSDVIWDGFWVDQADGGFPQSSNGQAVIGDNTRCEIRRGLFDRTTLTGGDNFAAIFAQSSIDCRIYNCLFRGGTSYNGSNSPSHNDACVSWYGNDTLTVEHCQTDVNPNDSNRTVGCFIYVKAFQGGRANSGIIRYCRAVEGMTAGLGKGIEVNAAQASDGGMEIYQNVIAGGSHAFSIDNATDGDKTMNVHDNTFVDSLASMSGDTASVIVCDPVTNDDEVTFRNNIVAHLADSDADHGLVLTVGFDLDQCASWDYNCYWHAGGTIRLRDDPTNYTTLAAWQTLWSPAEANSIFSNPEFVNYAAGNFRLANNGQAALTASSTSGPVGAYKTGLETIGLIPIGNGARTCWFARA